MQVIMEDVLTCCVLICLSQVNAFTFQRRFERFRHLDRFFHHSCPYIGGHVIDVRNMLFGDYHRGTIQREKDNDLVVFIDYVSWSLLCNNPAKDAWLLSPLFFPFAAVCPVHATSLKSNAQRLRTGMASAISCSGLCVPGMGTL